LVDIEICLTNFTKSGKIQVLKKNLMLEGEKICGKKIAVTEEVLQLLK
jgi:hypothetical protein